MTEQEKMEELVDVLEMDLGELEADRRETARVKIG